VAELLERRRSGLIGNRGFAASVSSFGDGASGEACRMPGRGSWHASDGGLGGSDRLRLEHRLARRLSVLDRLA
jgi:hypothetical protein